MAYTINRVTLLGTLGRDAESRSFQNGGKVVNLRLATSEQWKDRTTGEKKERTEWHSVAIFGDFLTDKAEHLRKGTRVFVQGQIQTRKWQDQQGQDRYATEIVCQGPGAFVEPVDKGERSGQQERRQADNSGGGGGWGDDELSDDVPFIHLGAAGDHPRRRVI